MSRHQDTTTPVIVAMRREDLPVPDVESVPVPCTECGAETWVGVQLRQALPDAQVVCTRCVPRDVQDIEIHPATANELVSIGLDEEFVNTALQMLREQLRRRRSAS